MRELREILLSAVFLGVSSCHFIPGTPEAAFFEFQTTQHKESFIVASLCAAGESVVPLLVEKVRDRKLKRRIYALGFLGTTFTIDEIRGRQVATEYSNRTDYVGRMAREILAVENRSLYIDKHSACNLTD